ncbi:MAG: hypothetical protein IT431_00595 [Phycisphaerales bacterium]|nr:hypothetical protein [Phycisphaerales bacterium]
MRKFTASVFVVSTLAAGAHADMWPHVDGSMKHLMVSLDGQVLSVHIEGDALEKMEMLRYPGEQYNHPADVLNEKYYNSRYGWLADGFIDLPSGAGIFVSVLDSDAGLEVYQGGMRSMLQMHTYAPILGTDGNNDPWQWGGTMVHNWYAVAAPGLYDATYKVYVGDASTGLPLAGYTPGQVTVHFSAVPAPGALGLLSLAGVAGVRRSRRGC